MGLKELYDLFTGPLRTFFATPVGTLAAFFVGALFAASLTHSLLELDRWTIAAISAPFGVAISIAAYFTGRPPKFKSDVIGILIATTTERKDEEDRIINDIIPIFRKIFSTQNQIKFEVKTLPAIYCKRINSTDDAINFLKQCNAVLMIQGEFKTRKKKGESHYVLTVKSLVRHKPTIQSNQRLLQAEMSELLPSKATIECQNDLTGMELIGAHYAHGVLYTIAIAALISDHPTVAKNLLTDLLQSLRSSRNNNTKLKQLTEKRILNCISNQIDKIIFKWRTSRDIQLMQEMHELIEASPVPWKGSYEITNARAIYYFVVNRNISASKALLNRSRSLSNADKDSATIYSLGFLEAYTENFQEANRIYDKAFKATVKTQEPIPIEVEEFIAWLLEVEPEKIQFYHYLSLINHRVKSDLDAAKSDIAKFFYLGGMKRFPTLARSAERLSNSIGYAGQTQIRSESN